MANFEGTSNPDNYIGTSGSDKIYGRIGNDTLRGEGGNDTIEGNDNDDLLYGGDGNDSLHGDIANGGKGDGSDQIYGEGGNDTINGGDKNDTIDGGDGADTIKGYSGSDVIEGGEGNDTIQGNDHNDTINGGPGNDNLHGDVEQDNGGDGQDVINGDTGNDTINGGGENDTIDGGAGADTIDGYSGSDVIEGGEGNDTINASNGSDKVEGGDDNDKIYADKDQNGPDKTNSVQNDTIDGGAGNDTIYGSHRANDKGDGGKDSLEGGDGDDWIDGKTGNDILKGGSGNDKLYGDEDQGDPDYTEQVQNDTIDGGAGNDTIYGSHRSTYKGNGGKDSLEGGDDNDWIDGRTGNDTIKGGSGNDTLYGDQGQNSNSSQSQNDWIDGGAGNDLIYGTYYPTYSASGGGNDTISGGSENDTIYGRSGNDSINGGTGQDEVYADGGNDVLQQSFYSELDEIEQYIEDNQDNLSDEEIEELLQPFSSLFFGEDGNDLLEGNNGYEYLDGGKGKDTVSGGAGNDQLFTGTVDAQKFLKGGPGNDLFAIGSGPADPTSVDGTQVVNTLISLAKVVITSAEKLGAKLPTAKVAVEVVGLFNNIWKLVKGFDGGPQYPLIDKLVIVEDFTAEDMLSLQTRNYEIDPQRVVVIDGVTYKGMMVVDLQQDAYKPTAVLNFENENEIPTHVNQITIETENVDDSSVSYVYLNDKYVEDVLENQQNQTLSGTGEHNVMIFGRQNSLYHEFNHNIVLGNGDDKVYQVSHYKGSNTIFLGKGDDVVWVATMNEVFLEGGENLVYAVSGYGGNLIFGGKDADQFWVLTDEEQANDPEWMPNVIYNFDEDYDIIGLGNVEIESFDDSNLGLIQQEKDVVISVNGKEIAVLKNVNLDDLTSDNFAFLNNATSGQTVMGTKNDDRIVVSEETPQNVFTGSGNDTVSLIQDENSVDTGSGRDTLIVAGTNNNIFAGTGEDMIFCLESEGDNIIYGGLDADHFWIFINQDHKLDNPNIIADFETWDVIGFANTDLTYDQLGSSWTLEQQKNDVVINAYGQELAVLKNVSVEQLTSDNFVFI